MHVRSAHLPPLSSGNLEPHPGRTQMAEWQEGFTRSSGKNLAFRVKPIWSEPWLYLFLVWELGQAGVSEPQFPCLQWDHPSCWAVTEIKYAPVYGRGQPRAWASSGSGRAGCLALPQGRRDL